MIFQTPLILHLAGGGASYPLRLCMIFLCEQANFHKTVFKLIGGSIYVGAEQR